MSNPHPDTLPAIASAVERLLADRGPLSDDELLAALDAEGVALGRDPEATLQDVLDGEEGTFVMPLLDGRWGLLPKLLAGRVFTHRLTAAECRHDLVADVPDLTALTLLTEQADYQHLTDGSAVREVVLPFDLDALAERGIPEGAVQGDVALLLPAGHFARVGAGPGDLATFEVTPAGWRVGVAAEDSLDATAAARAAGLLSQLVDESMQPVDVAPLVWTACGTDAELFGRPLPPLADLLDAAQLTRELDQVAPAGFDFPRWRAELRVARIRREHRLDDDQALAVLALAVLHGQVADLLDAVAGEDGEGQLERLTDVLDVTPGEQRVADEDRAVVGHLLPWLADPDVAEALLVETIGAGREGAAALGAFAESLEPMVPRAARVALRWLMAKAEERLGDVRGAESTLEAAESLDPDWAPVLYDLARYASDRGDVERGLSLLRRAGAADDDGLVHLLSSHRAQPRPGLARNQPCWCGSGRKYKQCHLHRERLSLDARADWLYQKAVLHLHDGPWREVVLEVAAARSAAAGDGGVGYRALTDPLVADLVLFEGEAFADFLALRGHLLPDDERLLADQWLLVERSLFEVEAVRPGQGLSARDLRTGDRHDVREPTAARHLRVGDLLCTRIVPAGESSRILGGAETVPLRLRDPLLRLLDSEPDPFTVARFLGSAYAPPTLQNTEGDPLVVCETRVRADDACALAAALDRTYERVEDAEPPQWHEFVVTHGQRRIRATLRLDGDVVHVDTNSAERADRVLATLRGLQPALEVLADVRQPATDLMEATGRAPTGPSTGPSTGLDPADPQVAGLLAEVARQFEQTWLDESIPALAGLTPRAAAADPTRRPDLIRLLDTFPEDDAPGAMSPTRLRAALGLPPRG